MLYHWGKPWDNLCLFIWEVWRSRVLTHISKAASGGLKIKSYASTKTEARTFDVRRILVFCILYFAVRPYACRVTWQPIAYTGCNRRNGPDFGRVFLMWNYTEKPQNTYIQSWTVWEIMASEVWNFDSCDTLTDYQIRIETGRNMWFL